MSSPLFSSRIAHLVSALSLSTLFIGCLSLKGAESLHEADELTHAGKYDEAIAAYHEHMQARLEATDRPEWENPYFYLLSIGDIELARGDADKALQLYEDAERQGVSVPLISDRYRAVAGWYEEHSQLKKALEVLNKYHERDALLFDSMLDRIARKLTDEESAQ